MTALPERQELVKEIRTAHAAGARLARACAEAGLSVRTYERWCVPEGVRDDGRPKAVRPPPAQKLSPEERQTILETVAVDSRLRRLIQFLMADLRRTRNKSKPD